MQDILKVSLVGKVYKGGKRLSRRTIHEHCCSALTSELKFIEEVRSWSGNFTMVLDRPRKVYVIADRIRSFPALINIEEQKVYLEGVSHATSDELEIEPDQIASFFFTGYTIGDKTVAKQIISVPAGHIYVLDKVQKKVKKYKYFSFIPKNNRRCEKPINHYIGMFDACYDRVFIDIIERARGRPIIIPLSAGYDSRLVLHYLIKHKYDNIRTFSYGNNNLWELDLAQEVAKKAKVQWNKHISTKRDRERFFQPSVQQFYWKSFNLEQVPQMNDYYAMEQLRDKNVIPPESIIINGQSGDFVDGGHIPASMYLSGKPYDLIQAIKNKHFSLWNECNSASAGQKFPDKLLRSLSNGCETEILNNPSGFYEQFEYLHRQTKFVVNGQRVYDHFELDWELPLWDQKIMEFWMEVPFELRRGRKLTIEASHSLDNNDLFSIPTKPKSVWKHVPLIIRCLQYLDHKSGKKFNVNERIANYFSTYSSLYPVRSFNEYHSLSTGHKNSYSFHTNLILKAILN